MAAFALSWLCDCMGREPGRKLAGGTRYSTAADSPGGFDFGSLPSGTYRKYSERDDGDSVVRVELGELILNPGDSIARGPGQLRFTGSSGESYFLDEILYKGAK